MLRAFAPGSALKFPIAKPRLVAGLLLRHLIKITIEGIHICAGMYIYIYIYTYRYIYIYGKQQGCLGIWYFSLSSL